MIKNLSEYFLDEQTIFLEEITYQKIDVELEKNTECVLNCLDNINAEVFADEKVKVTVTRTLEFEPSNIFYLKVAFGSYLNFDPRKVKEHDWHDINMAAEFRENGSFILNDLMSRVSLQIAQITSSYGQIPLILPPMVAQDSEG